MRNWHCLVGILCFPFFTVPAAAQSEPKMAEKQKHPKDYSNYSPYALYTGLVPLRFKIGEKKTFTPKDFFPGSTTAVSSPSVTIEFIGVDEDGRCRGGTGSFVAIVAARITVGRETSEVRFNLWTTAVAGKPSAKDKYGDGLGTMIAMGPYQVYLFSLNPYREIPPDIITPSQYVATFMIDGVGEYHKKQKALDLAQAELAKRLRDDVNRYWPIHLGLVPDGPIDCYRITFVPHNGPEPTVLVDVDIQNSKTIRFHQADAGAHK